MKPPPDRARVIDSVSVEQVLDLYLSLKGLASYSSLSVRRLRDALQDALHPLPHHRVGGKILVRVSDFDHWMHSFRHVGKHDIDRIVHETLRDIHDEERKRMTRGAAHEP